MNKTILITGSTDGIGLATAEKLVSMDHHVLIHGRNPAKVEAAEQTLSTLGTGQIESYVADLSRLSDVEGLAKSVAEKHTNLDVLINNAGVLNAGNPVTQDGLDIRFQVNTVAPYLLMQRLLPVLAPSSRVVNVSSAAQSPVDLDALAGRVPLSGDFNAYAQSKLALNMWSRSVADSLKQDGPIIVAVNPGSMLGSKMVQDGFGVAGGDIGIGADVLTRAALADEFASASGLYFDNDSHQFASPHSDALDPHKSEEVVRVIERILTS